MRSLFPGFYTQSLMGIKDFRDECVFIFDTNVLLNLFRYPDKPREMLLQLLHEISSKIWVPYQVAMEYHYNVMEEIISQNKAYDSLISSLNDRFDKMQEDFQKYAQRHSNLQMDEELLENVKIKLDALISDLEEQKSKHPDLYILQEELSEIIKNVGKPYTKEELESLYEIGQKRYDSKIPPGYKDLKKGDESRVHNGLLYDNKYGDFLLWNQILEHFKEESVNTKAVIFVTDDTKSDWWKSFKGIKKPHPELIQEFMRHCDGSLYIYTTKQFLKNAAEITGVSLEEEEVDKAIKGIDDYKKKKDIIELQETSEAVLDKDDLININPRYKDLNDDQWRNFQQLIFKANSDNELINAVEWAENQLNSNKPKFPSFNFNEYERNPITNRKRGVYPTNARDFKMEENGQLFIDTDNNPLEYEYETESHVNRIEEDDYSIIKKRIKELRSNIVYNTRFLPKEEANLILDQVYGYEAINDMDYSLKKLLQLNSFVLNKINKN